jgi:hypothetical protein
VTVCADARIDFVLTSLERSSVPVDMVLCCLVTILAAIVLSAFVDDVVIAPRADTLLPRLGHCRTPSVVDAVEHPRKRAQLLQD